MPTSFYPPALITLIAGPTASGKSALALQLAQQTNAWIVNADSMQVYKELDVLSARPDKHDLAAAPHKLYGFVDSREEFSVGRYLEVFAPLLANARAHQQNLIVVGGTGLYFRALTQGLMPTPSIPPEIRKFWREKAEEGHDLHTELQKRDPERAAALHPHDRPRLLRAIELYDATGRAYSDWLKENPGEPILTPQEYRAIFLSPAKELLLSAIDQRFRNMIDKGALQEVERLACYSPPLPPNLGIMKAHGVPHLLAHLAGKLSLEEAIQLGQADTRAYARRQMIFARRYLAPPLWTCHDPFCAFSW